MKVFLYFKTTPWSLLQLIQHFFFETNFNFTIQKRFLHVSLRMTQIRVNEKKKVLQHEKKLVFSLSDERLFFLSTSFSSSSSVLFQMATLLRIFSFSSLQWCENILLFFLFLFRLDFDCYWALLYFQFIFYDVHHFLFSCLAK